MLQYTPALNKSEREDGEESRGRTRRWGGEGAWTTGKGRVELGRGKGEEKQRERSRERERAKAVLNFGILAEKV